MADSICYCGTQCNSDDCFCDECNGLIPSPNCAPDCPCMIVDVPEYENDTPFVVNN
jgi:hypothetical protein